MCLVRRFASQEEPSQKSDDGRRTRARWLERTVGAAGQHRDRAGDLVDSPARIDDHFRGRCQDRMHDDDPDAEPAAARTLRRSVGVRFVGPVVEVLVCGSVHDVQQAASTLVKRAARIVHGSDARREQKNARKRQRGGSHGAGPLSDHDSKTLGQGLRAIGVGGSAPRSSVKLKGLVPEPPRPVPSDRTPCYTASPAARPVTHAHRKLWPPIGPNASSSSPHRWRPGARRDSIVRGSISSSLTPPPVTSAFL